MSIMSYLLSLFSTNIIRKKANETIFSRCNYVNILATFPLKHLGNIQHYSLNCETPMAQILLVCCTLDPARTSDEL